MRTALPCFLALSLSTALAAQATTVIPSAADTTRPTRSPFYSSGVFYSTTSASITPASRSQTIVDCADIAASTALWRSIEVRRPVGLGNANPAITTQAVLTLSVSTSGWGSATSTFGSNHGPAPKTVINGSISLPAASNQSTWPAPWQPKFPFSAPFVYTGRQGGSLVVDLTQTQSTGASSWYVEYTSPNLGGRESNGANPSSCLFSNNKWNSSLSYTTGGLNPNGGTWYVSYNNLLPNVVGVVALSAFGVDNKGTWPLPINMAGLGAPGCEWNVGLEIGFLAVLTADANGRARMPNVTIPPGLGGVAFYDQTLWLDAAANQAGFVVGRSSKWLIGDGKGAPAAFVYATGNSTGNATGRLTPGAAPTFRFQS